MVVRVLRDSGDSGMAQEAKASRNNMTKSLTAQTFGVPSHGVLELIETSDKFARLSEAGYSYETRVRELEHQFESKAAELREEYLSIVLQIHESPER
jgi:hypothetical protein